MRRIWTFSLLTALPAFSSACASSPNCFPRHGTKEVIIKHVPEPGALSGFRRLKLSVSAPQDIVVLPESVLLHENIGGKESRDFVARLRLRDGSKVRRTFIDYRMDVGTADGFGYGFYPSKSGAGRIEFDVNENCKK